MRVANITEPFGCEPNRTCTDCCIPTAFRFLCHKNVTRIFTSGWLVIREGSRKSFDPQYRESTKPRSGTRAGKTLGSRNAGSRLGLVFGLSQFFAQARRFGAIL